MAVLVPAISLRKAPSCIPYRDRRDKPGDDDGEETDSIYLRFLRVGALRAGALRAGALRAAGFAARVARPGAAAFAGRMATASVSSSAPSRASLDIWMVVLAGGFAVLR